MAVSIDKWPITIKSMYEKEEPLPEGPKNIEYLEHLRRTCFGDRMDGGIDKSYMEIVDWKTK